MTEKYEEVTRHNEGQKRRYHHSRRNHRPHNGGTGSPVPRGPELTLEEAQLQISPLKLFSAYHLGVTENEKYHLATVHEVARRFNTSPATIDSLLTQYHLTKDDFKQIKGFDLTLARLDIEVAPPGISRSEIAKQIFEEFQIGG